MADPTLTGANVTFHANDENKDDDTQVSVVVHIGGAPFFKSYYSQFNNYNTLLSSLLNPSLTRYQFIR